MKKADVAVEKVLMYKQSSAIEVLRDVEGALIPSGVSVTVKKGSKIMVTQSLGNAYTIYVNGNLVRVPGKDGDALGLVILADPDVNEMPGSLQEKIDTLLKSCFDPEIPVNIVDLGLVYACKTNMLPDSNHYQVIITMTLTAPGCGMGPVLVAEIEQKIRSIHEVAEVKVDLVFDPSWSRDMMSDVAKLQLGIL